MNNEHFFIWNFLMDFKILLLILQTSLLVHTNKNATIIYGNLVDELNFTTKETLTSTLEAGTVAASNTSNFISIDKPEFHITDYDLIDQKNFVTEIYEETNGLRTGNEEENESTTTKTMRQLNAGKRASNFTNSIRRIVELNENTLHERIENPTTVDTTSISVDTTSALKYHENSMTLSSTVVSIHNGSHPNNDSVNKNSTSLVKSLLHSFYDKIWTLFFKPIFGIISLKIKSNVTDNTQKINKFNLGIQNSSAAEILSDNYIEKTTTNISTSNDSNAPLNESNPAKLVSHDSVTANSSNLRVYDVSEAMEDTTTTIDPITSMPNVIKAQSKNDSLILKIDTIIFSTTETVSDKQKYQPNNNENIKDEIIEKLFNAKNNSLNDDAVMMFMNIIIQNYNNSKIRRPFSSRYSGIHNFTSDLRQKSKREILFNREYNSADRQELESYFHNDQKMHENYLNHAKLSDQGNLPPNNYNADKIYNRPDLDSYSIEAIYMRNPDNPTRKSSDESLKFSSNIAPHFDIDLNDSSLLYLIDRLGYPIFNDDASKLSMTRMNMTYEPAYLRNEGSQPRTADQQQKQIGTRKNSNKNAAHRRRSSSSKQRKIKTQRTKTRRNRMKLSKKSAKKNGRRNDSRSSKYLRPHSKYKRRNNNRNMSKKKRRASLKRTSRNRKSKQNRGRNKHSTQSRSARYSPL